MADFEPGDVVRVAMPRGKNDRGVMGVHVMYATSQEAKCDGAIGTITDVKPDGTHGIALYRVDFAGHEQKVQPPYTAYWFRQDWIQHLNEKPKAGRELIRPVETS